MRKAISYESKETLFFNSRIQISSLKDIRQLDIAFCDIISYNFDFLTATKKDLLFYSESDSIEEFIIYYKKNSIEKNCFVDLLFKKKEFLKIRGDFYIKGSSSFIKNLLSLLIIDLKSTELSVKSSLPSSRYTYYNQYDVFSEKIMELEDENRTLRRKLNEKSTPKKDEVLEAMQLSLEKSFSKIREEEYDLTNF